MLYINKDSDTKCWLWNKALNSDGYGKLSLMINGKKLTLVSHRVSFQIFKEEKLEIGKVVDHTCRNKACANPEHLRQVDYKTNVLENSTGPAYHNSIKRFCINNHEMNADNSYQDKKQRRCKICISIQGKKNRLLNREKNREYLKAYRLKQKEENSIIYTNNKERQKLAARAKRLKIKQHEA